MVGKVLGSMLSIVVMVSCTTGCSKPKYDIPVADRDPTSKPSAQKGDDQSLSGAGSKSSDQKAPAESDDADPRNPTKGKPQQEAYLNGWTGQNDEIPQGSRWIVQSVADQQQPGANIQGLQYSGGIRISLAHPFDPAKNEYELLFATSSGAATLGLCVAKTTANCNVNVGPKQYFEGELIATENGKNFFKMKTSALIENNLVLKVIVADKSAKIIDARNIQFVQSGNPNTQQPTPNNNIGQQNPQAQGGSVPRPTYPGGGGW